MEHMLQRLLTAIAYALGRCRWVWLKDRLIDTFVNHYDVNLLEARESDPYAYACFDDFFTRALAPNKRPQPVLTAPTVGSPVDGCLSQWGTITQGKLVQAKGLDYTVQELIGEQHAAFEGGTFFTQYLAPIDYHRIHMPVGGRLLSADYHPGQLFSVKPECIASIPRLFARNERAVLFVETEHGRLAMVLVAATLVSGLETPWTGLIAPGKKQSWSFEGQNIELTQGQEMGRFHFGSTVICLFSPNPNWQWVPLEPNQHLRLRQPMAKLGKRC